MDLRSLKYFIAVFEEQTFSAAAKRCFVAQPSISAAVAQLEQHLNVNLFTRHARGVTPTLDGKKLYPLAKKLHGQADAIQTVFKTNTTKPSFNLGVTRGLGVKRMSALLKDFTAVTPDMELTLVPPQDICDARIITKEELSGQENFLPLWQEDYLLAMPYNHILSLKETVKLSDFDNLPMIQRTPCSAWRSLEDTLALTGVSLESRAKIQTIDYALGLVSAGLGCALLPAYSEVLEHKDIVFRKVEEVQLRREIVLAYQQESPILAELIQLISQHR